MRPRDQNILARELRQQLIPCRCSRSRVDVEYHRDFGVLQLDALWLIDEVRHQEFWPGRSEATTHKVLALFRKPARPLRNENDFAEGAGLQNFFVGAGSLGERQLFPDDRPQRAILQTGNESSVNLLFFGLGDTPQRKGVNRPTARHEVARRDGDVAAAANDDNAAVRMRIVRFSCPRHNEFAPRAGPSEIGGVPTARFCPSDEPRLLPRNRVNQDLGATPSCVTSTMRNRALPCIMRA